ncbi:hypothetical protein DM01DRAFT_1382610 [Hesseltinella vesiculosa]|uniref:Uncharacterized protein n=1 Tax=Hesseltinella vesiculosa TaxID=101127 RepID=A0A1X2GKW1_9FUNG|nr:hypothetical protein DM01DRAFT_1382610 [Hesseltinella vesiculosa]
MAKSKQDTPAKKNEVIKTQIDQSMGIAHSLIESWLPPPEKDEKINEDDEQDQLFDKFSKGRPDRLGLGAKYLSHNEAVKATGILNKHQVQLKNKILNQNARHSRDRDVRSDGNEHKKRPHEKSDDEDERETASGKRSKKKKKK